MPVNFNYQTEPTPATAVEGIENLAEKTPAERKELMQQAIDARIQARIAANKAARES